MENIIIGVLLLASVVGLTFIIERGLALRAVKVVPPAVEGALETFRTADDLPYTPHFESLYGPYAQSHPDPKPSRAETWRHLLNLRKGGKLPKLGEAKSRPPTVTPEEITALKALIGDDLGRRDRLPYTERFDNLVDEFNRTLPRKLSPHLVWRLVATLAK